MVSVEQWQRMTPKQQWDLFVTTDNALANLRRQIAAPPVDEVMVVGHADDGAPIVVQKPKRGEKPPEPSAP